MAIGVYPGTFDPLTIAHLAVAEAALRRFSLERVELVLSVEPLGKPAHGSSTARDRVARLEQDTADRDWLQVTMTRSRLIADIAAGYDVVIMGADKWMQVNDPHWYDDDPAARDAALATLPQIAVAPRWGVDSAAVGVPPDSQSADHELPIEWLEVPDHLGEVSSTAVREGRVEWAADFCSAKRRR